MISALLFAAAAAATPQFVLAEHPTLRWSERTFILARMRWDYEYRGPASSLPAGKSEWGFVRRRFSIEGSVRGKVAYEVEIDLEGDERWKDVYAEYTPSDAFHLRAGKAVVPFGYERTTSLDVLDFAYRSMMATHLVPPRDQGVVAFGRVLDGKLSYDAGVFEDGGGTFVGRMVARPTRALEFGTAMMESGLGDDVPELRGQTALGVSFFQLGRRLEGRRRRLAAHAVYRSGPAALKSEFITVRETPDNQLTLRGEGWYVAGSLVLTGEPEADSHHPRHPITRGGLGSVEVAARTEALAFKFAGMTFGTARAHTVGVTWQPHRFFRVQWNAIRDVVAGRSVWSRVLRFHLTI